MVKILKKLTTKTKKKNNGVCLDRKHSMSRTEDRKKKNIWKSMHLQTIKDKNGKEVKCKCCSTPLVIWEKRYIKYNSYGEIIGSTSYIEETNTLCQCCNLIEKVPKNVIIY
jgi:hypothetical protein